MINIKIDSRKVQPGDTFVALPGANVDGHDFVNKAIENGATKVVISKDMDVDVEKIIVEDTNDWLTNHIASTYKDTIKGKTFPTTFSSIDTKLLKCSLFTISLHP